jgi:mannose-6-phosphate isomerase
MVDRLECRIMPYAWGSRSAIAELQGRAAKAGPEAEMWMGAHPVAPSTLVRDASTFGLDAIIERDPERELGERVVSAFGSRLPFLFKIIAAAEPLSLQAHPNAAQAREGWDDEEKRGIPRDAPNRNYRDASHKPELVCALTPFEALCGFRRASETLALLEPLGVRELEPALSHLRESPDDRGLERAFRTIMTTPEADRLVSAVVSACKSKELEIAPRLAKLYPGDVGVVSALLLNHFTLAPGEALHLDAGNLHAYLGGTAVEIMASSDNVLRGGLTKKHVDVPELMRVLVFANGPADRLVARKFDQHEAVYDTPTKEFRLSRLEFFRARFERRVAGPEILLCTEGEASIEPFGKAPIALPRGEAAFVPASTKSYVVKGRATLYRATTNLG